MKFKLNLTALESRENPSGTLPTVPTPPVIPLIPILNEDGTPYIPPIIVRMPGPYLPLPGVPTGPVGY